MNYCYAGRESVGETGSVAPLIPTFATEWRNTDLCVYIVKVCVCVYARTNVVLSVDFLSQILSAFQMNDISVTFCAKHTLI